ncbi:MAG: cobyrinate a,c-diamide synthase [Pseudomonadota bacterium]
MSAPTILIAAPASGSGKTILSLGLISALRRQGLKVGSFKIGPDYIDPRFLEAASERPCLNADSWAMRFSTLAGVIESAGRDADIVIGEGVMGLFDGAPGGKGSTADIAAMFGIPVILLVDVQRMGASAAALIEGFRRHRDDVAIDGIVLGQVASDTHDLVIRYACDDTFSTPVLGSMPRRQELALPSRHLGLVQALEHAELALIIDAAASLVEERLDLGRLRRLARHPNVTSLPTPAEPLPPLGRRIAIARDAAFSFGYPLVIDGWRSAGAEIALFSPLADEPPARDADAVYLPGGYPELHAGRLAANAAFLDGLRQRAKAGATIYGECGGYMVLGQTLVDRDGVGHTMAGLLPVTTSFAEPKLHLGYRQVKTLGATALGEPETAYAGHEFHYASELENKAAPIFDCQDAHGKAVGSHGAHLDHVFGSFIHLIDRTSP